MTEVVIAADRIICRFYLKGNPAGKMCVIKIESHTGERIGLLATGIVVEGGWVDLAEPIMVRAGEAFIAVLEV